MELKSIFIIIVDISGYTRFIKRHKVSLLHAEKIIGELMESILDIVQNPVVAHEILGDAVSLYAEDTGDPGFADDLYKQTLEYFKAFQEKEASLISNCMVCDCDACVEIGKLKLKAILHFGEVAFTKVKKMQKISGENVILAHRLLKNSIPSNEYILLTSSFVEKCEALDLSSIEFQNYTERCEGIGPVNIVVKNFEEKDIIGVELNIIQKLYRYIALFIYSVYRVSLGRFFDSGRPPFRHIPYKRG